MSPVSNSALRVGWISPSDIGGAPVSAYKVEYDYAPSGREVQVLSINATSASVQGTFALAYNGFATSSIPYDASATRLESALESLSNIGDVDVTMDVVSSGSTYGITWTITFLNNVGDVGDLSVSSNLLYGNGVSVGVYTKVVGQSTSFTSGTVGIYEAPLGSVTVSKNKAVQSITVNTTSTDLHGGFKIHNSGETSNFIGVNSSAAEVETILESMMTIGDVTVTMVDHTLSSTGYISGYGRTWFVTFEESHYQSMLVDTETDSIAALVATGGLLKGTLATAYVRRVQEESLPQEVTITGLSDSKAYVSRITASNGYSWGTASTASVSSTPKVMTPESPQEVFMSVASDTEIQVWWDAPENDGGSPITGYTVQWDTESNFGESSVSEFTTNNYLMMKNLKDKTNYKVRVAAYNANGYSTYAKAVPTVTWAEVQTISVVVNSTRQSVLEDQTMDIIFDDSYGVTESTTVKLYVIASTVQNALNSMKSIDVVFVDCLD
jgi:hypothetical protein